MSNQASARRRRRLPLLPIGILVAWTFVALFAPLIAPHSQSDILGQAYDPPNWKGTWLGADYFGRDLLSRIVYGSRTTLALSLAANLFASFVGIFCGFLAAYAKGAIDEIVSRIVDGLMAFPTIMFALILVSALGSSNVILVCAVGFIESIRCYRIARAVAVDQLAADYVNAARLRGEGAFWIMAREVLPNTMGPLLTDFGTRFSATVMLLSAISFLGLGVQPPQADWGMMVRENIAGLRVGSLAPIAPALAIFSVTFASNKLVDWVLSRSHRTISTELVA